MITEMIANNIA